MAYLVFFFNGQELDRRALTDDVVIGRSPECDISVRDIILSRKHCRVERCNEGWAIVDLESKNGTFVAGQKIGRQMLRDGSLVQIGRTRVCFRTGSMVAAPRQPNRPERPPAPEVDPNAGTMAGFVLEEPSAAGNQQIRFPRPQPKPVEPAAFQSDGVADMLSQLVSSSWDSIYATASRPVKPADKLPRPILRSIDSMRIGDHSGAPRRKRASSPVALCLAADSDEIPTQQAVLEVPVSIASPDDLPPHLRPTVWKRARRSIYRIHRWLLSAA